MGLSQAASIPIIRLGGNLVVSIQVALSDAVVARLKDDVANALDGSDADGLIIDVSGLDLMDSYISKAISDMGLMAGLMGVRTVISGLDPTIAMTLVEMGMEMTGVQMALNMEQALLYLHRQRMKKRRADRAQSRAMARDRLSGAPARRDATRPGAGPLATGASPARRRG